MKELRLALIVGVTSALTAGLVMGSRVAWVAEPSDDARIRLSWKALGEHVEECRVPTEAELAALPAHMRMREICERRLRPFHLSVSLDGERVLDETIRATGAREDRPVAVFREFRAAPGPHRLAVRFEAERGGPREAGPRPRSLDAAVDLAPRQILLVTLDDGSERLTIRDSTDPAAPGLRPSGDGPGSAR